MSCAGIEPASAIAICASETTSDVTAAPTNEIKSQTFITICWTEVVRFMVNLVIIVLSKAVNAIILALSIVDGNVIVST